MNKEKLIKEYDEKAKALRDEFISKLKDDKKEFELTYPEDGETVYCIDDEGEICDTYYFDSNSYDKYMFEHGLYFETYGEAEQHLKESKLIFKLKQWAKIHNEGWEPNWSDWDINKFIICYDGRDEGLEIDVWGNTSHISVLPAFKTREITQACIDEFGEEIREVLC
jgi:hypothetical protein